MSEYKAFDDNLIVNVERGNSYGYPISVWVWDDSGRGEYVRAYESTVFADSYRECVECALTGAGFEWNVAADLCDGWGLEYPNDDEGGND